MIFGGGLVISIEERSLREMHAKLKRIFSEMEKLPVRRRGAIQSIMERGIIDNHRKLGAGGTITLASGRPMFWPQVRHPFTVAIRKRLRLGPITPMLSLTGRLERGLIRGGSFSAGRLGVTYRPSSDIAALLEVHHRGLAPLPSRRTGKVNKRGPSRVPVRRVLVWSKPMADGIMREAKSLFNEVKRS